MKLGKEFKTGFLVTSICYLVLGIVLLVYPAFSQRMLCYALGAITVIYGVVHVVTYFARTDFEEIYRLDFATGVVMTIIGVYIIAQPAKVMTLLHIILGCAILLDSLIKLQNAIDLKRLGSRIWWSVLALSLITGALGLVLLLSTSYAMFTLTQFIGLCLVVDGCVNVWSFLFLSINLSKLRKTRAQALAEAEEKAHAVDVDAQPMPAEQPASAPYAAEAAPQTAAPSAPVTEPAAFADAAAAPVLELAPDAVTPLPDAPAAQTEAAPAASVQPDSSAQPAASEGAVPAKKKFSFRSLFGFDDADSTAAPAQADAGAMAQKADTVRAAVEAQDDAADAGAAGSGAAAEAGTGAAAASAPQPGENTPV